MLEGEEHINVLYSSYRANVHCIYILTISFGDWNYLRGEFALLLFGEYYLDSFSS